MDAARAGHVDMINLLVNQFQANVWAEDCLGRQALHFAAQVGISEVVMLLVKLGADPNQAGRHQMTPLHYAAKEGHTDVVVKLLQCGADVSLTDKNHRTGELLGNCTSYYCNIL